MLIDLQQLSPVYLSLIAAPSPNYAGTGATPVPGAPPLPGKPDTQRRVMMGPGAVRSGAALYDAMRWLRRDLTRLSESPDEVS